MHNKNLITFVTQQGTAQQNLITLVTWGTAQQKPYYLSNMGNSTTKTLLP
jgi:hypothetical protein